MNDRLESLWAALRAALSRVRWRRAGPAGEAAPAPFGAEATLGRFARLLPVLLVLAGAVAAGCWLAFHPPLQPVPRGEVGLRVNQFTGQVTQWRDGLVLVVPGLHRMRVVSLRDRTWRPDQLALASGPAPVQSVEGLSVGIDLTVRYAVDPAGVARLRELPTDLDAEIVEPAVQNVVYKVFARYTVREIFATQRAEIQAAIEAELGPRLAADAVLLRSVLVGKVDLPADYKRGMESLLAEELATQKMRYTLELKDKRVRETELEATADKVRREVRAEAAAREQVIAARAQEEAMRHVLPFKERQIEQRRLEAEAEKQARLKVAEGSAQARRIEAGGEADARRQLAEAEAFRLDRLGQASAEQMAREGTLLSRHPLLIQKTLADKLSDKVQVIIAPPGAAGGFIGANLLGGGSGAAPGLQQAAAREAQEGD
ncbi:SPFH domain-containing protein [Ramlibacter tataouinensis]|uniref:SPFH domain-containing protein n=1 Tax=Ramlibacter tataouinensis TaxID=94132 RepID=UPI0022F37EB0|nr:SPFH domain-containing protein [Ramlibacter tataouinensis]WBY00378.1 SPFH domain-containing protein [Ramlibacter tataouinensis]